MNQGQATLLAMLAVASLIPAQARAQTTCVITCPDGSKSPRFTCSAEPPADTCGLGPRPPVIVSPPPPPPPSPEQLRAEQAGKLAMDARVALSRGDYQRAIELFRQASALVPADASIAKELKDASALLAEQQRRERQAKIERTVDEERDRLDRSLQTTPGQSGIAPGFPLTSDGDSTSPPGITSGTTAGVAPGMGSASAAMAFQGPWRAEERRQVERVASDIPDKEFLRWLGANVPFVRESRGGLDFVMGVREGRINVHDSFFKLKPSARRDVLAFEAGKAFWLRQIGADGQVAPATPRGRKTAAFLDRHREVVGLMRFGLGPDATLTDNDEISHFAFALRVAVLKLDPPARPPADYTEARWAALRVDWFRARREMGNFIDEMLSK